LKGGTIAASEQLFEGKDSGKDSPKRNEERKQQAKLIG